jgi:glyoxylase I family protein
VQIEQCLHTAILVSDLAKAEQFYGEVLGLEKDSRSLKYPGAWYRVGDVQFHLILDETTQVSLSNSQKWGRNPHVAFKVKDINSAIAKLTQHNYAFQMSASGRAALFVRDPDGNMIELSQ